MSKDKNSAKEKPAAELRPWFFPEQGVTVHAASLEEAQAKLAEMQKGK